MKNSQITFEFYHELRVLSNLIFDYKLEDYLKSQGFSKYLVVLSLPEIIKNDVKHFKDHLANKIGFYDSRFSIAHVSILSFWMRIKGENTLLLRLEEIAAGQAPFNLTICNFNSFSSSTIYLEILEKELFSRMSKNFNKNTINPYLPNKWKGLTTTPHVTIAKNLNDNFNATYDLFRYKTYNNSFIANAALVLKKYSSGNYELLMELPFLAKPSAQQKFTLNPK